MIKVSIKSGLARNAIWMFAGQGLRLVIQAVYFLEIARSLGARNYGAFVGVVALVGIAFPFGDLGSGGLLIKNVSRDKDSFGVYWGRALRTTVVCSTVLFVAVLLLAHFVLPTAIPMSLVVLVAASDLLGMNVISICGLAFQAFDQLKWTATISVLTSTSRLVGATMLIAIHPHPSSLQWGYIYCSSTATVTAIASLLVLSKLGRPIFNSRRAAAEIREGFYFSTGLSAQTVYNDIDKAMLTRLGTLEAAGIYGAAYRIVDVSFAPVAALLCASYPSFFRAGGGGIGPCLNYAKPMLVRALGYTSLTCIALLLCAGAVPYFLGPGYIQTAEALRWLAFLPVLKASHYFLSNTLTAAGYQGFRMCIQVLVALFNFFINLWIIPLYSWRGAAWSSLASDGLLACGVGTVAFVLLRRSQASMGEAKVEVSLS